MTMRNQTHIHERRRRRALDASGGRLRASKVLMPAATGASLPLRLDPLGLVALTVGQQAQACAAAEQDRPCGVHNGSGHRRRGGAGA